MQNSFPVLELFDIYESLNQIIIIGTNDERSIFKIMKIARWTLDNKNADCDDWFLNTIEDQYVYSSEDIEPVKISLTTMTSAKLIIADACGIVGFVRFKQGYYMILVTKKSQVARLGQHKIYKVEDTSIIYLPGNTTSPWDQLQRSTSDIYLPQTKHPEEKRYLELFKTVDLSIDNYFSYTYDLSNTVQYNMAYSGKVGKSNESLFAGIHKHQLLLSDRYVWNWSLWPPSLRPSKQRLEAGCMWLVALIHGYVGQSCVLTSAGCITVRITLIARRSRHFAGTRFLKRGANQHGNVANEVETEQVIFEEEGKCFEKSKVTSLVQLRGSIPLQWHHEMKKVVGKPPIKMTIEDAYYTVCGRHFATLLYHHGGPVIIFNLVKQSDRNRFEKPLSTKFVNAIDYLKDSFIESELKDNILEYIEFDMAKIQRGKVKSVLDKLAPIAERCIRKTGFFCSDNLLEQSHTDRILTKTIQCGVVRTNCIDCLDRTNTAQFVIGQAALGYQMYMLGIINTPKITAIQTLDRMLQSLYESHGNVLALQYGGSELVHNVETYRKNAKFSAQSRDFVQTISRYYNNKFSDQEKQMSINIFLGIFKPWQVNNDCIWNHKISDMYLHDKYCYSQQDFFTQSSTNWLPMEILGIIPKPLVLWHKWRALSHLLDCGDETKSQDTSLGSLEIETSVDSSLSLDVCHFEHRYTHFIDEKKNFLSIVNFLDPVFSGLEERRGSTVFFNGSANWSRNACESVPELDPASTLANGPVMKALRNEKSVSSNSTSDSSDEEDERTDKRNRSEAFINDSSSMINSVNDHNMEPKYLSFCIRDYQELCYDVGSCVNSSSSFLANNVNGKVGGSSSEVKKDYSDSFSYSQLKVCEAATKLYRDTLKFNRTGTYKAPRKEFYVQYLKTLDFGRTL